MNFQMFKLVLEKAEEPEISRFSQNLFQNQFENSGGWDEGINPQSGRRNGCRGASEKLGFGGTPSSKSTAAAAEQPGRQSGESFGWLDFSLVVDTLSEECLAPLSFPAMPWGSGGSLVERTSEVPTNPKVLYCCCYC